MKKIIFMISLLSSLLIAGLTSCDDNVLQNVPESGTSAIKLKAKNKILSFDVYPYIEISNGIGKAYAKVFCGAATLPSYMDIMVELSLTSTSIPLITRTVSASFAPGQTVATSSTYPCGTSFTSISATVFSHKPIEIDGYDIYFTCFPGEVIIK